MHACPGETAETAETVELGQQREACEHVITSSLQPAAWTAQSACVPAAASASASLSASPSASAMCDMKCAQ